MSSSNAAETQLDTRQGRRERCRYGATASPSSADSVVRNTAGLKCGRSMILLNHSGLKEAEAAVNQRGWGRVVGGVLAGLGREPWSTQAFSAPPG